MIEKNPRRTPVGVFGATGTTGVELVRRLLGHPTVELKFATSREHAGKSLRTVDPSAPNVSLEEPSPELANEVEVVFAALPHGHSATWVERVMSCQREPRVVDLSGDFRLRSPEEHAAIYGSERSEHLAQRAVYGLTELFRAEVAKTRLVANPGCYPTCSALALSPLVRAGALSGPIVINALSGVSGAGRGLKQATQFIAVYDDARPYKLGRSHRHAIEIEQTFAQLSERDHSVIFNPHVVPIERGMLATITVSAPELDAERAHSLLVEAYGSEPFVEVLPFGEPALIRAATRSNRAVIGVHPVEGTHHLVVTCAIDNLVKGAAGQAIQNMNVMLGIPETTGFEHELNGAFS